MTYKLTLSVGILAIAIGALAMSPPARAEILEQILVKVNGEIFTKTDLEARQITALRQRNLQVDPKTASNQQLKLLLDDITPTVLVDAVSEMLLVQRGKELGYALGDEQFKNVIDNIKKENKLETEEQFQAALKSENLTLADLRKNLERQMLAQRVQQNEVIGKLSVNDDESQAYYRAHITEFTTPPTISLRELLVAVPADARGVNVGVEEEAKAKIDAFRARAIAGESFETLVAEGSDSASKANGGLVGPLKLTDLSPELKNIIEPMTVGGVTPVLRSDRGFQIFKLESATPTEVLSYEQAKDQIGERVFASKRKELLQKYLEKLRAQAIIEWKNQELKKAYDLGLKQLAAEFGRS